MKKSHLVLLACALVTPAGFAAAQQYTVEQLPGPPGASINYASGIVGATVAGESYLGDPQDGNTEPVLFGGPQASLLSVPAGDYGTAAAVNGSGEAAGYIWSADSNAALPVVWQGGQLQALPTGSMPAGNAYGINSGGTIVGDINDNQPGQPTSQAAMWTSGQLVIMGDFPGLPAWSPAINNQGQAIVLVSGTSQAATWIWSNGGLTQLPSLGGNDLGGVAINDAGHVAGTATTADNTTTAFLWNGSITEPLEGPPGAAATFAYGLNNSDEVVGSEFDQTNGLHAMLWENGQAYDLNSLIPADSGWLLQNAIGILDDGTIVGDGVINGQSEVFELTPDASPSEVPEPASLSVLALGGFALLRRRRRAAPA